MTVRGAMRWMGGDGLLFVVLLAAWFPILLILWWLAKVSGLWTWFVGLEDPLKIGAAIIGAVILFVLTVPVFRWIIRKLPAQTPPPASARPPDISQASAWLAMGGAVISVTVALIVPTGNFTLLTSIVGFILATYIGTFLDEYGGTYFGHLARSEIIVIIYLLIFAPLIDLAIAFFGGTDTPFVTMCYWNPDLFGNCEPADGVIKIKLRDLVFLVLFFLAFALHLRFAPYLPVRLGGPKPKQVPSS